MSNTSLNINEYTDLSTLNYFGRDYWALVNSYKNDFDNTCRMVAFIDSFLEGRKAPKLLDIMCGNCRHILTLHKLGYQVSGIDVNGDVLDLVKQTQGCDKDINFYTSDIRYYDIFEKYDAITWLTSSVGYYGRETDLKIMKKAHVALNDNGVFFIDIPFIKNIISNFKNREWHEVDGVYYLFSYTLEDSVKYTDTIILDGLERRKHRFKMRLYDETEYLNMLKSVGFSKIYFYYDWMPKECNTTSRLQIVAIK